MRRPNPDPLARFFGAALMAVGGLIVALCGLCSVTALGVFITDAMESSRAGLNGGLEWAAFIPWVVIVGGVPAVVGLFLFFGGRALYAPTPSTARTAAPASFTETGSDRPMDEGPSRAEEDRR